MPYTSVEDRWYFITQAIAANSILIQFYDTVSPESEQDPTWADGKQADPTPELSLLIRCCQHAIVCEFGSKIFDVVGAYNSIVVHFNVKEFDIETIQDALNEIIKRTLTNPRNELHTESQIEIPVYYAEETGPDLKRIAQTNDLLEEDVITIHCQKQYTAYAVGFAPGFAYLGFVSPKIKMQRLSSPRKLVPQGSVAIADQQTAVYPSDSPGGWNIIGRTPLPILKKENIQHKGLIQSGDSVKFFKISREEYLARGGKL